MFWPKYDRVLLSEPVADRLKAIVVEVCDQLGAEVLQVEVMLDHVHLLVEIPPSVLLSRFVQLVEGRLSWRCGESSGGCGACWRCGARRGLSALSAARRCVWWAATSRIRSGRRKAMALRCRLYPPPDQEQILARHCEHARVVWNAAVEQLNQWRPGRLSSPGYAERNRQLTEAREQLGWLAEGSSSVQQQALRDFHRFFPALGF